MDIQTLTKEIAALAEKGPAGVEEQDRFVLVDALTKLRDVFESPLEKLIRITFAPYDNAALRLGVDMGLFDTAVQKGGPVTVHELAEARNLDPALVQRIIRLLTTLNLFTQQDSATYTATPLAAAYTTASPLSAPIIHLSSCASTTGRIPEYLAANGYQNPGDAFDGPWQFTHTKGETVWDWLAKRPREQEAFNKTMEGQKMARSEEWWDLYPVEERLKLGAEAKERVALVDIGGGWGHDLKLFHEKFSRLPGKLVLEDQASVIESAKDLPGIITPIGHDFFTPQPPLVHGAKAYYLRMTLHDWPDKQARIILGHIRDVMEEDSVLLINESVLPDVGAGHFEAQMDLHMMVQVSALERTEGEWRALLEGCGFAVKGVWGGAKRASIELAVIEAVRK